MLIRLALKDLEDYAAWMEKSGIAQGLVQTYSRILKAFYKALPTEKCVDQSILEIWVEQTLKKGCNLGTMNVKIAAVNGLLSFLGHSELRIKPVENLRESGLPVLTRAEYIRLLQTAKMLGKERTYLIIKSLCVLGMRVHEIIFLTVEGVSKGMIDAVSHGVVREIKIPEFFKMELMQYVKEKHMESGPIFVSGNGKPLDRTIVFNDIKQLAQDACVDEEKANPRCLFQLYQSTQEEISRQLESMTEYLYIKLLEQEEITAGWQQQKIEKGKDKEG